MNEAACTNLEAAADRVTDALRFTDMPRTSRLFNDFLYDYPKVARFYPEYGRAESPLADHAKKVGAQQFDREGLAAALRRINTRAGSPQLTFDNIEILRRPGSVAIVTGQQAGLFTGPLYTIHKAMTVIKLAACLREQGVDAVPVFWIASEDHDYEEVDHCRVIDQEGRLKTVRYAPDEQPAEAPVGRIAIDDGIGAAIEELLAALPPSEFLRDIEGALRQSYTAGTGFADAFARLMACIFKDYGVVLLDPLDEGLKQIAAPLYSTAISRAPEIAHALVARSRELEAAGYHAQVHVSEDSAPLFIMDDGRRVALTQNGGRFHVKGSGRSFDQQELAELAARCPNCFSPNVTLRPVVQDWLLPTAAYIGGPAEIAYFAQIRAVYQTLDRQEPCVLPRASFTIIEHRHRKTLKKLKLQLQDFFEGLHPAIAKVVEQSLDRETANSFKETEQIVSEQMDKLEAGLRRADGSLSDAVKNARAKMLYQLEHLRTRFVHTAAHREEAVYRQVERAYTTLVPDKNLQERELNVFYFLARYGPSLLRDLYDGAEIGYSNHTLLYLSGMPSQVVNAPTPG